MFLFALAKMQKRQITVTVDDVVFYAEEGSNCDYVMHCHVLNVSCERGQRLASILSGGCYDRK